MWRSTERTVFDSELMWLIPDPNNILEALGGPLLPSLLGIIKNVVLLRD